MGKKGLMNLLLISVVIVALALLFASQAPDGLEKVAGDLGFLAKSKHLFGAVMPDYLFSKTSSPFWRGLLMGTAGVITVFLMTLFVAGLMKRRGRFISSNKR